MMVERFSTPPAPLADPRGDRFPVGSIPDPIRWIVADTCRDFGVPIEMGLGAFMGVLSTAQGRSVIRPSNTWSEPGQVWPAIAAEAGARKSPILKAARQPLITIQEELMAEYRRESRLQDARLAAQAKKVDALQTQLEAAVAKGAFNGIDVEHTMSGDGASGDSSGKGGVDLALIEAALQQEIDLHEQMLDETPRAPKLWIDGPSSEKLHDLIAEHRHLGIVVPEGKKLLDALMAGHLEITTLLSAYSMETTSRELVTRPVRTAHEPSLAMLFMIQTEFLRAAANDPVLVNSGFIDRLLLSVVPRYRVNPVDVCTADLLLTKGLHNMTPADQFWNRLVRYEVLRTRGLAKPLTYGFKDADAVEVWRAYEAEWLAAKNDHAFIRETALSKLPGQALRAAKTFAQGRIDPLDPDAKFDPDPKPLNPEEVYPVSADDLMAGFAWAWNGFHNFERLVSDEWDTEAAEEQLSLKVLAAARRYADEDTYFTYAINAREAGRRIGGNPSVADLHRAFDRLVGAGWAIEWDPQDPRKTSRHILVRSDFVRWLVEYQYEEASNDPADPLHGTAA